MYDFNVYEKRVLYNLVKLAQSQLEGVRLSENLFRIDHSLKGFVLIELPISYFLTDSEDKNHVRIKEALKSLHQKTFTYKDEEVWECFSIIANPKIQLRSSKVSFIVNSKVWDVLLDFSVCIKCHITPVAECLGRFGLEYIRIILPMRTILVA